jgi:arsenate reductase (glutaredoxin)
MYIVYGIKNCDTVKKALRWLDQNKIDYIFHDFKSKGITDTTLKKWSKQLGWEPFVNKKGLTWKKLSPPQQEAVKTQISAIQLMQSYTSVIKRPVIELDGEVVSIGFDENLFTTKYL